jgi:hypothetical protein
MDGLIKQIWLENVQASLGALRRLQDSLSEMLGLEERSLEALRTPRLMLGESMHAPV